jgi:hypothetical protein
MSITTVRWRNLNKPGLPGNFCSGREHCRADWGTLLKMTEKPNNCRQLALPTRAIKLFSRPVRELVASRTW